MQIKILDKRDSWWWPTSQLAVGIAAGYWGPQGVFWLLAAAGLLPW